MQKIALLIDADNINSQYFQKALNISNSQGAIVHKIAAANWKNKFSSVAAGWISLLKAHPDVMRLETPGAKNSADLALCVYAMKLLYEDDGIDTFAIMSSDQDFTHLSTHIHNKNKKVVVLYDSSRAANHLSRWYDAAFCLDAILDIDLVNMAQNLDEIHTICQAIMLTFLSRGQTQKGFIALSKIAAALDNKGVDYRQNFGSAKKFLDGLAFMQGDFSPDLGDFIYKMDMANGDLCISKKHQDRILMHLIKLCEKKEGEDVSCWQFHNYLLQQGINYEDYGFSHLSTFLLSQKNDDMFVYKNSANCPCIRPSQSAKKSFSSKTSSQLHATSNNTASSNNHAAPTSKIIAALQRLLVKSDQKICRWFAIRRSA